MANTEKASNAMSDCGSLKIDINRTFCKSCGICIAFCPKKVYEGNAYGQPQITDCDKCTKCMLCVERCPEFAIEITGNRKKGAGAE